jgi:hypothetical protein
VFEYLSFDFFPQEKACGDYGECASVDYRGPLRLLTAYQQPAQYQEPAKEYAHQSEVKYPSKSTYDTYSAKKELCVCEKEWYTFEANAVCAAKRPSRTTAILLQVPS